MKHLSEIVRELCWNSGIDQSYDYLVTDRNLEISYEDIQDVERLIDPYITELYSCDPYNNKGIDMNSFVDSVEEKVWEKFKIELSSL
jgi:hypothetical protein